MVPTLRRGWSGLLIWFECLLRQFPVVCDNPGSLIFSFTSAADLASFGKRTGADALRLIWDTLLHHPVVRDFHLRGAETHLL